MILTMLVFALGTSLTSLPGQSQNRSKQEQKTAQRVTDSDKRKRAFESGRVLLLKKGVPFEPNILLEPDWREKLKPFLARIPEMQLQEFNPSTLEGARLADVFRLPEKVQLKGDALIIANRIVFEGKNFLIKGNHAVHLFAINSLGTAE